jgi:hypothetical protein
MIIFADPSPLTPNPNLPFNILTTLPSHLLPFLTSYPLTFLPSDSLFALRPVATTLPPLPTKHVRNSHILKGEVPFLCGKGAGKIWIYNDQPFLTGPDKGRKKDRPWGRSQDQLF